MFQTKAWRELKDKISIFHNLHPKPVRWSKKNFRWKKVYTESEDSYERRLIQYHEWLQYIIDSCYKVCYIWDLQTNKKWRFI